MSIKELSKWLFSRVLERGEIGDVDKLVEINRLGSKDWREKIGEGRLWFCKFSLGFLMRDFSRYFGGILNREY